MQVLGFDYFMGLFMKRLSWCSFVFTGLLWAYANNAAAFCGFYVAGGDASLFNDATQAVLMREGNRTVLSMQNNYDGPPEDFALNPLSLWCSSKTMSKPWMCRSLKSSINSLRHDW